MRDTRSAGRMVVVCILTICFGFTLLAAPGVSLQGPSGKKTFFVRHRGLLVPHSSPRFLSRNGAPLSDFEPVPIPGGDQIPGGPLIHSFLPGPPELGFEGLDVEPNGITNFRGFVAQAYLAGSATDNSNNTFDLFSDMRVYQGEYVAADGSHHHGTFVLI